MHEYGLMEDVVSRAMDEVRRHGGGAVARIRLEVGELASASPDALLAAFEALTQGTPLAGAAMDIETVSGILVCSMCRFQGSPTDAMLDEGAPPPWICPECGHLLTAIRGKDIVLAEVVLRLARPRGTDGRAVPGEGVEPP